MVRFFTFSGPLFYLFWSAFLPFLNKIKKRTQKNRILKNYLICLVRLVRLVCFFMLLFSNTVFWRDLQYFYVLLPLGECSLELWALETESVRLGLFRHPLESPDDRRRRPCRRVVPRPLPGDCSRDPSGSEDNKGRESRLSRIRQEPKLKGWVSWLRNVPLM